MRINISRRCLLRSALAGLMLPTGTLLRAQNPEPKEPEKHRSVEKVNGRTLYDWSRDLRDKDPSIRERAIANIKAFGPDARPYASDVIKALKDKDVSLKVNAAITLGIIGMDSTYLDEGIKGLEVMLEDSQGIVRYQAMTALGRIGVQANTSVAALVRQSRSISSWEIRQAAVHALGEVGWISPVKGFDLRAFTACLDATRDVCMEVRYQAVLSLLKFGEPKIPSEKTRVLHALKDLITDKEPKKVSLWARVAVMRIEDNVTSAHLAEIGRLMTDHFLEVRVDAARALGAIGPQAFPCVPDLIGALRDESPDVQFWACFALGAIGPKADKALNALEQLTSSEDKVVREAARKAMDSIGNKIQKISGAEEPMPAKKQAGGR